MKDSKGKNFLEDAADPITEFEPESSKVAKRSQLEVVIHNHPSLTGYAGTANRAPARPKDVRKSTRKPSLGSGPSRKPSSQQAQQSPPPQGFVGGAVDRPSAQPDANPRRQESSSSSKYFLQEGSGSDVSVDELSSEHFAHEDARLLLARHKNTKEARAGTIGQHKGASVELDHSSDEESKRADIQKTEFLSSKTLKSKKGGAVKLSVVQLFAPTGDWLVAGANKRFSLRYQEEHFHVYNENGSEIFHFTLNSIQRIFFAEESNKIIIHKVLDDTFAKASKICLELGSLKESSKLLQILQNNPTITKILKDSEHLDKVYTNTLSQIKSKPHGRRPIGEAEEPDDIQRIKRKAAARYEETWSKTQESKRPNGIRRTIHDLNPEGTYSQQGQRGSKVKQTRSSQISLDSEGPQIDNPGPPSEVIAEGFNGLNASQDAPQRTRSATRLAEKDCAPRPSSKQQSPPPDRWTEKNPEWADHWKSSLLFPRDGKRQARVDKENIERLDEGEFLNDNLIGFYLRWLEHRLGKDNPELAKRIYFQNTYFYSSLTTCANGRRGINYHAVARWTTRVDLLSYDYVIVPVNEHTHWYVAIICNAPKLLQTLPKDGNSLSHSEDQLEVKDSALQAKPDPPTSDAVDLQSTSSDPEVNSSMKMMSLDDGNLKEEKKCLVSNAHPAGDACKAGEAVSLVINDNFDKQEAVDTEGFVRGKVVSDLGPSQATPPKKGKRKSTAVTPRKYDPTEPRIITLDSLGIRHSPTCTNLRDYLVAEIKAKHNIDIPPPGSIGMTATHLPMQDNFCDCGLFLLSYIEKFLDQPDEFVRSILQAHDLEIEWPKASDMRNHIRSLLFDLQAENLNEDNKPQKAKRKQALKVDPEVSNLETQAIPKLAIEPFSSHSAPAELAESRSILSRTDPIAERRKRTDPSNGRATEIPDSQDTSSSVMDKSGTTVSHLFNRGYKALRDRCLSALGSEAPVTPPGAVDTSVSSSFPSLSGLQEPFLGSPALEAAKESPYYVDDRSPQPLAAAEGTRSDRSEIYDLQSQGNGFSASLDRGIGSPLRNSIDQVQSGSSHQKTTKMAEDELKSDSEMLMPSEPAHVKKSYAYPQKPSRKTPPSSSPHFESTDAPSPASKKRKLSPQKSVPHGRHVIDLSG